MPTKNALLSHKYRGFARCLSLLSIGLFCLPSHAGQTFTNFQDAQVIVGQPTVIAQDRALNSVTTPGAAGVAVSSGGVLAISAQSSGRVLLWNRVPNDTGQAADVVIGAPDFASNGGTSASLMNGSNGVAFTPDGQKLIVADSDNNRVLIWNSVPTVNGQAADVVIGQTDFTNNSGGTSATQLNYPAGVTVTPDGKLIVGDLSNNRVLIYNSVPTSNGAAADVVIGQTDFVSNSGGTSATQLTYSWHSTVAPDGKLIINDEGNNRVLVYNSVPISNGAAADVVIGQSDFVSSSGGTSASKLSSPLSVQALPDGKLAVGEYSGNRVLIYNRVPTQNGAVADTVLGQPDFDSNASFNGGVSARSIQSAYQLATDKAGRLFVAGRDMNRVMIFAGRNSAPTDLVLAGNSVLENQAAGTTVGNLSTTDADSGDTFTYALVEGAGAQDNAAFRIEGDALKTGAPLDFETKPGYNVRIRTTDAGGLSFEKAFAVTVSDVNEAPSFTIGADQTVAEESGAQSVANFAREIKTAPAGETDQKLTFVVTNDNNALFSVQPALDAQGTLTYTLAARAAGNATVIVTLKDDGGTENGGVDSSAPQTFAITATANPLFIGVSLSPAGPFTRDKLTATPRIAETEGVTYSYNWLVNGVSVQDGPGNVLNLATPGVGDKGDKVSVTLTAKNARGGAGSATNQVTVRNSNPFAFSGATTTKSGVETVIAFRSFGNPGGGDADNDALTYKRVGGPTNGVAAFETDAGGNNILRYKSRLGFTGTEAIRFVAVDNEGRTSNVATLSINVTGGLPTASDVEGATQSGVAVDVPLLGTDPNGGEVSFKRVGGPVNGSGGLVVLADGTTVMRYLPRANFVGIEEIRYVTLNAAGRPSNVATIRISVSSSSASAIQAGNAPSGNAPSGNAPSGNAPSGGNS